MLKKILKNPFIAFVLIWRRVFPFGIKPKDMEAYRIGSWSYGKLKRVFVTEIFPGIEKIEATVRNAFDKDFYTSADMQEVFILCSIMKHCKAKNVLEIGTFDGNTTLNLALNLPMDGKVTTVDLPQDWDGSLELQIPEIYKNVTERSGVGRQYHEYPELEGKIKQVFGDSAKLDWNTLNTPFDMIFLDGCHHYEYVKKDTENALKHLKKGGVLLWHDYGMIEDVSRVVDTYIGKLPIYAIRGTRIALAVVD
jgi:predicted O-methyltransferase YrrM